jgi:hypothetical protein
MVRTLRLQLNARTAVQPELPLLRLLCWNDSRPPAARSVQRAVSSNRSMQFSVLLCRGAPIALSSSRSDVQSCLTIAPCLKASRCDSRRHRQSCGMQQSASRDDFGQARNVHGVRLSKNYVAKPLFSNIVLVFHIVRSMTASLRVSATRAFQLPDLALSRNPHCFNAMDGDARYKITVAASNSSLRVKRSPVFDIRLPMSTSPD